jgi:hypothetical protein
VGAATCPRMICGFTSVWVRLTKSILWKSDGPVGQPMYSRVWQLTGITQFWKERELCLRRRFVLVESLIEQRMSVRILCFGSSHSNPVVSELIVHARDVVLGHMAGHAILCTDWASRAEVPGK